jgi:PhnB protein
MHASGTEPTGDIEMRVNPYLTFNGNCAEAFAFYAACLETTAPTIMTQGNSPAAAQTPPGWEDKVLHARLAIGDTVLMGSDAPPDRFQAPQGFSVSLILDDPHQTERFFAALSEGGTVRMPVQETFWAIRFGMLVDKFGIPWMLNCEKKR